MNAVPAELPVLGREGELEELQRFLDSVEHGPRSLLMDGDPGVGKTTLWQRAASSAVQRSHRVLACRPAKPEADLAFSALGDLLAGDLDGSIAQLPGCQRRALDAALLRAPGDGPPPDRRTICVAVLGVVRSLAGAQPLLLAIDDIHWVDRSTAEVLSFALRRLTEEPVGVLAVVRSGEKVPESLAPATSGLRVDRLGVRPLDLRTMARVLRARLGKPFPRPILEELHRVSGGNPLLALELGRVLLEEGLDKARLGPLPVPDALNDAFRQRLLRLPARTRKALMVASALARPTVGLVQAAVGGSAPVTPALARAVDAGIVEIAKDCVRFAHPLLASAAYQDALPDQRRSLHRRLGQVVPDPEERARHLALAAVGTDPVVAQALEGAARSARARGAPGRAAELAEQAWRLTPAGDDQDASRRTIAAADYRFEAGDVDGARRMFERLAAALPPGSARADVLHRLGWVRYAQDSVPAAAQLFAEAVEEAGDHPALRLMARLGLVEAAFMSGDYRGAASDARITLDQAEELGDPEILVHALIECALMEAVTGEGHPVRLLERAMALEGCAGQWRILQRPRMFAAVVHGMADDLDVARAMYEDLYRQALERGDEISIPNILFQWSEVECRAGDWATAERLSAEACEVVLHSGKDSWRAFALYHRALVDAHLGREEQARRGAEEGLALAERTGAAPAVVLNHAVLGFLELSRADPAAAHRQLGPITDLVLAAGVGEPGAMRFVGDEIEALISLGCLERAKFLTEHLGDRGRALGRSWAIGVAARCRGLIEASLGDPGGALLALDDALRAHERLGQPFEVARTLLAMGTIQRRAKRKRDARRSLERALALFEGLGAALWSHRTRAELARIGGRSPAPLELTETERRVADLVVRGGTNREVADAMFVSVRTVEANLTKVYQKLGVRSRAELAHRLAPGAARS